MSGNQVSPKQKELNYSSLTQLNGCTIGTKISQICERYILGWRGWPTAVYQTSYQHFSHFLLSAQRLQCLNNTNHYWATQNPFKCIFFLWKIKIPRRNRNRVRLFNLVIYGEPKVRYFQRSSLAISILRVFKNTLFSLPVPLGTSHERCFRKLLTAKVISQGKAFALVMKKALF